MMRHSDRKIKNLQKLKKKEPNQIKDSRTSWSSSQTSQTKTGENRKIRSSWIQKLFAKIDQNGLKFLTKIPKVLANFGRFW